MIDNEIMKTLTVFGWQPTSVLTFAFGSDFSVAIKRLHAKGLVVKHKNGWKATS